jgi:subtilisin family serine protease
LRGGHDPGGGLRVRLRSVLVVLTVGLVAFPASAFASEPPESPPADTVPASDPNSTEPGQLVTLITGDVIKVAGKGKDMTATVQVDAAPVGDVSIVRADDKLYAVPGVAGMLLAKGSLDPRLFDLTELLKVAEHSPETGLAGAGAGVSAVKALPLIVQHADPTSLRSFAAKTPDARTTHALPSINAQAVGVAREKAGAFWDEVTDASPAKAQQAPAGLTLAPGIEKIWLDGVVEANLDVSRKTVGAEQAWAAGYDGTGTKVAVLDTGIDTNHPDLAGRVVLEKSFVPGESPHDGHFHGTHVSSIVAGSGVASGGRYAGVAPGARLINGKVLDNRGSGSESAIIDGMEWAAGNGADVVSMSLGTAGSSDGKSPMELALNAISKARDVLFVVAAGNNQNAAQSVGSPGAADLALTVANVERDGSAINWSSSVGPRMGDNALKPEISAPGTNITAAGAGTNGYRSLTGTSMSTPHVAAAAAILLQKHPDWSAQRVKDTLMGSAVPTASDPIYWQGAGIVRADRAIDATITSTGALNLGSVPFPQPAGGTASGSVRFTNATGSAVTLGLSATFQQAPKGFTRNATPFAPPAGSVQIQDSVVVPANGTADVPVTVDVSQMPYASVFGRLVATAPGQSSPVTATQLSWTRETELHQLKLRAIDRAGDPLRTTLFSYMWLWDLQSGTPRYVAFNEGVGFVEGKGYDPRLEPGRYALIGYIGGFGPGPRYPLRSWTMVAEPEIVLDQPREFMFDARKAGQVKLQTERYTAGGMGQNYLYRGVPGHELTLTPGTGTSGLVPGWAEQVFTLQGGKAATGTFEWKNFTTLQRPPYVIRIEGDRTRIPGRFPPANKLLAKLPRGDLNHVRLVDLGGANTPDLSNPQLKGGVAVWHPTSDWDGYLRGAANDAAKAGALALVVVPPADMSDAAYGPLPDWPMTGDIRVVVVRQADAANLLAAAGRGGRINLDDGHPSPYSYAVVTRQEGGLTNGQLVRVRERDMVRQDVNYHGSPGALCDRFVVADQEMHTRMYIESSTPDPGHLCGVTRQEFFTPGVIFEATRHSQGLPFFTPRPDLKWVSPEATRVAGQPGNRTTVDVGSGPWVPGYGDQAPRWLYEPWARAWTSNGAGVFSLSLSLFTAGPDLWNALSRSMYAGRYYVGKARLLRENGQLVCEGSPYGALSDSACTGVVAGRHRLELDVSQTVLPLSTQTHSVWDFTMAPADFSVSANAVQPVLMLGWHVGADLHNLVSSRSPAEIQVTPYFAKTFPAYRGDFRGTLSVSYDDGATWTKVGTDQADAGDALKFRAPPPQSSNGYASYRVTVTDDHGNTIDQSVIRAAYAPTN